MKIYFKTTRRPKAIAKKLKKAAQAAGIELKLGKARQVVARMYGFPHWNDLYSSLGSETPSPMDGDVADEEVTARRGYQSRVLAAELGIEIDVAAALVNAVPPTGPFSGTALGSDDNGEPDLELESPRYW